MKTPMERVAEAKAKITEITVDELRALDLCNKTLVDVREAHEHAECKIGDCINIPRGMLEFEILKHCDNYGMETELILFCKTGGRSALAAEALVDLGFSKILSLAGGIEAWNAA